MKLKLTKLYASPEIFKPIEFQDGINIIMGEKVDDENIKKGKKTNGVGKSLCIEFINFCLLKSTSNSRVEKIPFDKLSGDTKILLDLEINSSKITITRTNGDPEKPIITNNSSEIHFNTLDDASKYLGDLLFSNNYIGLGISFREFLGPFLREEGSEFKDIMMCYENNSKKNVPPAIKPNAFLFGLDIAVINQIQKLFKKIKDKNTYKNELKRYLTENNTKKINEIKATLNSLNDDLRKINSALDSFNTNEAYSAQEEELAILQVELDSLRNHQSAIRYQIKKLKSFPSLEDINIQEIEIIYNQFKSGLGDIITKSVTEVVSFKKKIDEFQKSLINDKLVTLNDELYSTTKNLNTTEEKRLKLLNVIDQKGILKDVKNGYAIFHEKKNKYANLQSRYESYELTDKEWSDLKLEKDQCFQTLNNQLFEAKKIINSFNTTILSIHEYIMDSNEASFDIKTVTNSKSTQVLAFEMRIADDGSHSVNRTKVFIYDLALLFNEYTKKRHPHFLIHDNIFDVDQDSLVKSLNYLANAESQDFQYILTLNRDKIENEERLKMLNLKIEDHKVAYFTKENRFLFGNRYSES